MTTKSGINYHTMLNPKDDLPHNMSHQLARMMENIQTTINKMDALDQTQPKRNHRSLNNEHKQYQSYRESTHDNRMHKNVKFDVPSFDGSLVSRPSHEGISINIWCASKCIHGEGIF